MIPFIIRIAVNAVALLVIANVSGGAIFVKSFGVALVVALVLGVANATVKPILMAIAKAMTCVLSCLTLGLWSLALSFLINGFLFWITAQYLDGIKIRGNSFWTACFVALALSVINSLATVFTRREDEK